MTKAELVANIAKNTGLDKSVVLASVEGFMETVKDSLSGGENVYLRGFGTIYLKKRAEKKARNITAGTTVVVPEHNIPAFKPCDEFKDQVLNGNKK